VNISEPAKIIAKLNTRIRRWISKFRVPEALDASSD
jgi:hypothetical protein